LGHAATGKWNVGGDDDVVRLYMCDNPIIGGVETVGHDLECDPWFVRGSHPGVGDQGDLEPGAACDPKDLLLDRTCISIDKDVQQTQLLLATAGGPPPAAQTLVILEANLPTRKSAGNV
jgi:hypothetical protein